MRIKIITSNPGKVKEFQEMFDPFGIEAVQHREPYDEIQTSFLEEVVERGMDHLIGIGLEDFIIDDSGLFINRLNGFPGVWSAYALKTIGNDGILRLMGNEMDRSACFKCCIGGYIKGRRIKVTGICEGSILRKAMGDGGFGFDPIFTPDGKASFAEMSLDVKNKISHRGDALNLLMAEIRKIM